MDNHICLSLVSLGAALCCGIIPYSKSQVVADVVDDQVFVVDTPNVKGVYNPGTGFSGDYSYYYPLSNWTGYQSVTLSDDSSFTFYKDYVYLVSGFSLVDSSVVSITLQYSKVSALPLQLYTMLIDNYVLSSSCPSVWAMEWEIGDDMYINGNPNVFSDIEGGHVLFDVSIDSDYFWLTTLSSGIIYTDDYITGYPYRVISYEILDGMQPLLNDVARSYDSLRASYENQMQEYGASEFNRGRIQGYNEGRNSVSDESASIITLFGAVANVPISVLNGMGQFVVWDVSIISILATFMVIAMFAWVIRKVI